MNTYINPIEKRMQAQISTTTHDKKSNDRWIYLLWDLVLPHTPFTMGPTLHLMVDEMLVSTVSHER